MPWAAAGSIAGALIMSDASSSAASQQTAAGKEAQKTIRADLGPYRGPGQAALSRLQELLGISSPAGASIAPTRDQFMTQSSHAPRKWAGETMGNGPVGSNVFDSTGYQNAMDKYNQDLTFYNAQSSNPDYGSLLKKFSTQDMQADPVYNSGLQFGLDQGIKGINARSIAGGNYDSGATLKALTRYGNDYGSTKANESYNRFTNDQSNTYNKLFGLVNIGQSAAAQEASGISNIQTGIGNVQGANAINQGNIFGNAIGQIGNQYQDNQLLRQLNAGGQRSSSSTLPDYNPPSNYRYTNAGAF